MWDLFFEFDQDSTLDFRFFEKRSRPAHCEIVIALRDRWIIAPKFDPVFAAAPLDLDFVVKRNRRNERFNLMKLVAARAQNFQ